ncbi:retrotransposon protein, putative, unclassified [Tanacetum coccineum]
MSNSNTNLQTQSSNALHNAIMEAGSKDRPPISPVLVKMIENGAKTGIYGFVSIKSAYYLKSRREPATITEDDEMSKDKEIDKLMALISLSFKKIYKPTNNNLRTSSNISRANQDNSPRINRGTGYDNQRVVNVCGPPPLEKCRFKRLTRLQLTILRPIFDDEQCLSFTKPEFLIKAQRANPRLYDIGCYNDNLALMLAPESDEMIHLDKESQSKLIDLIRPFDYDQLNNLYDLFVPQREKSPEQHYFPKTSKMSHTSSNNEFSKDSFHTQTTLLEKRMDKSIPWDQKCKSSKELFKIKKSVDTIFDGVKRSNNNLPKEHILEMVADLRYFNSLEHEVDTLKSQLETQKTQFLNEIDRLSREYYYADHMNAILDFSKSKSVTTQNVSHDFSKPVTAQILPQNVLPIFKNTNVIAPGMYKVHTKPNQTRTPWLLQEIRKTNKRVSFSTRVIPTTSVSRPQLKSNQLEDRVMSNNSQGKKQEVEDHRRNFKFSNNKTSVTACNDSLNAKTSNVNFVCVTCGKCVLNDNHDLCVLHYINGMNSRTRRLGSKNPLLCISTREPNHNVNQSVCKTSSKKKTVATDSTVKKSRHITRKLYEQVSKTCSWWYPKYTPPGYNWKPKSQIGNVNPNISKHGASIAIPPQLVEIILFIVDSGCSKHMTRNLKLLTKFVEKFLGTVKFGNDQIAPILGYGDLVQGTITIKRVYYVERANHNLFFVGQFCDADLEVAFRKSTCYIRDLKGNDLLTGSRSTDLYSITLLDSTTPNLIYLMAKETSSQAWLWHRRLSHLNFYTINLLSKNNIVNGLPKLKFVKDHLCSSCELGKAKRKSFHTKTTPSSKRRLQLLHMDLCGPMRVEALMERNMF